MRGLPMYVREAAEYEPEGDHILCRWGDQEWIMPIHIALAVRARLGRAIEQMQERRAQIISLPAQH